MPSAPVGFIPDEEVLPSGFVPDEQPAPVELTPLPGDRAAVQAEEKPTSAATWRTPEEAAADFAQFQAKEAKRMGLHREQFALDKEIEAQQEPSALEKFVERRVTPHVQIIPTTDLQPALERFLTLASPTMTASLARQRAVGGEPLADIVDPETKKTLSIISGVSKGLADNINFFTSDLGIATLGMGALPKALHAGISLAFAAQMAQAVPEIATQLGDELGQPEEKRNYRKIAELVTSGIAATGFSAMGAAGAGRQVMGLPTVDVLQGERMADIAARRWAERSAQDLATRRGFARQQFAPGGVPSVPPGESFQLQRPGLLPSPDEFVAATPAREPLGPPAPTDRPTATPQQISYSVYNSRFFQLADQLRKQGRPDMTRQEVQEMFPDIFKNLERGAERAGLLAKHAWGEEWKPVAPEVRARAERALPEAIIEPKPEPAPPPAPESPPTAPPTAPPAPSPTPPPIHPLDEFEAALNDPKAPISNRNSIKAGLGSTSIDDLNRLLRMRGFFQAEHKWLEAQIEKGGLSDEQRLSLLQRNVRVTVQNQLVREAIEAATNTGSWIEGEGTIPTALGARPLDWQKNPEVAKWLTEHADEHGISLPKELTRCHQQR